MLLILGLLSLFALAALVDKAMAERERKFQVNARLARVMWAERMRTR